MTASKNKDDEYTPEETARRMEDAIRRSFSLPHKPLKQFVGTTPAAKSRARLKAAKGSPRSK